MLVFFYSLSLSLSLSASPFYLSMCPLPQSISGITSPVQSVGFNNTESWIGAGSKSGVVKVFDMEENKSKGLERGEKGRREGRKDNSQADNRQIERERGRVVYR